MFTLLKRTIKAGWNNFSRDRMIVAANVFILVMTICAINSLFLLREVGQFLISSIQSKVDISVYFKLDTPEEDILKAKDDIAAVPEVKEISYVSREEALKSFTERHKDEPVLIESLDELGSNPFLPSLNIQAFEASQYQAVSEFLSSANFSPMVEKVDYFQRKPVIERIYYLTSNLNKAGIVFSFILVFVAIAIAFTTIRLAIYNSREEIKVQKLVGASNWFIRGPFIIEGAISGFIAALISFLFFFLVCWLLSPKLEFLFPDFHLFKFFMENYPMIILIQLLSGIGLGVISSFIAIRRYLRV